MTCNLPGPGSRRLSPVGPAGLICSPAPGFGDSTEGAATPARSRRPGGRPPGRTPAMIMPPEPRTHPAPRHAADEPTLPGVIGTGPAMREVYRTTRRVAPSRACVLIVGETGTGKELVARAIHDLSLRSSGPYIRVNCGALTESLLGERTVRPRQGLVHRRRREPHRPVRGRAHRQHLPGRDQQHLPQAPGQAPPRPPGGGVRARRRHQDLQGRHPVHRRDQPRPPG